MAKIKLSGHNYKLTPEHLRFINYLFNLNYLSIDGLSRDEKTGRHGLDILEELQEILSYK
tara:strand:- start:5201 stop:5380 length:180 start_codon:yes stop_codon:yes gene_type:complete